MDSTAVLLRGFSAAPRRRLPTTPSVVGRQLALLSFRCNLSSVHLLVKKSNENHNNNRYGRLNKNNNGIDIQCGNVNTSTSGSSGGGFPSPNARLALQSLLCFSYPRKNVEHTDFINDQKKNALRALLNENSDEVERTINRLNTKYGNNSNKQIQYDAKMAIFQILIHMGTENSWKRAVYKYNEILQMKDRPSDATFYLYYAVILTLRGRESFKALKEHWANYVNLLKDDPIKFPR